MSDFLILGGGVVGLFTALELTRRGETVTVLEQNVKQSASIAGAGILSALPPWQYSNAVLNLTKHGALIYDTVENPLTVTNTIDIEYRKNGMLVLDAPDIDTAKRWCDDNGVACEISDPQSKGLPPSFAISALWLPSIAQLTPPYLVEALCLELKKSGCRIVNPVEGARLEICKNEVMHVETAAQCFSADHYIVSAGAWSQKIMGNETLGLNLYPVRGQILLFKIMPGRLKTIIFWNGTYLVPRDDGHVLVGSTLENVGFDMSVTEEARWVLLAAAQRILPELNEGSLVKQWSGLRPGSPNNIPTIDMHPHIKNLWVNAGHFRYGLTMAPASAEILVNKIYGLPQPFDVTPYRWPQ